MISAEQREKSRRHYATHYARHRERIRSQKAEAMRRYRAENPDKHRQQCEG
jgi:hypothetical protein